LTAADLGKIEYIYRTFWEERLDLRFSSIGRNNSFNYPTLREMLMETDRQGRQQSYLSSEERFLQLKTFQSENRLIPIVGDFANHLHIPTILMGFGLPDDGLHSPRGIARLRGHGESRSPAPEGQQGDEARRSG
jgi:hypothetical protein